VKKLVLLSLLFLTACEDETPPHLEQHCVKSHIKNTSHMTTMGCGMDMLTAQLKCGTGMIWVNELTNVCDERASICVWGRDWKGPKTCRAD
jgi:hypothetical protein